MSGLEGTFLPRKRCACHTLEGKAVMIFFFPCCGFWGLSDEGEGREKVFGFCFIERVLKAAKGWLSLTG